MNQSSSNGYKQATFAAGCFWGVEDTFRQVPGVTDVLVGYTGGQYDNPTYEDVCSGRTGHAESVLVTYDPNQVSYEELLRVFWDNHNPTTLNRQGPDIGSQYRSAIFFGDEEQKKQAAQSKEALERSGRYRSPIVTEVSPASKFWPAEEYHQKYFAKHGLSACHV